MICGDSDSTRVTLRKMVIRLESRFSQNESIWVTVNDSSQSNFYNIFEFLMDKPSSFAHKKWAFFASMMIKIGANFLFCLSSFAMLQFKDQVSPPCLEVDLRFCFHGEVSRAQYIDTLSWHLNIVIMAVGLILWPWVFSSYQ